MAEELYDIDESIPPNTVVTLLGSLHTILLMALAKPLSSLEIMPMRKLSAMGADMFMNMARRT